MNRLIVKTISSARFFFICAFLLLCTPKYYAFSLEDSLFVLNPFTQRETLKALFDNYFSIPGVRNAQLVKQYSSELESARNRKKCSVS